MLFRHMTDYPTVEEVLALAVFSGCRILGGSAGCQRRVRGVNLTDTPDYARWLSPGELLLTTGFALAGDEAAIEALLPTAAERGLAGVGIKPGRFLPDPLPGSLAREADRLGSPSSPCRGMPALPRCRRPFPGRSPGGRSPRSRPGGWKNMCVTCCPAPWRTRRRRPGRPGSLACIRSGGTSWCGRAGSHPGKWDCWRA